MTRPDDTRVMDLMSATVPSIDGLATVAEAMALMRRYGVQALVVGRRDAGDEVGLVSVTDIARDVVCHNRAPDRVNVYEIMSKPIITLPPEMLIRYAVRLLVRFGISRAVVVDSNRSPVGMVSLQEMVLGYRMPGSADAPARRAEKETPY